ncbi:hypothetical protein A2U01_0100297, partial [Trifolium medium]|nr:hypothetical protein [Trifolium medium]
MERIAGELRSIARRAGRMARCARQLGSLHQRGSSSGASRSFIWRNA